MSRRRRPPSLYRASEVPQIDPRTHSPNANPPIGTVGPNVPPGHGDTEVMHAEAWAGWPNGWGTPWYEPSTTDERVRTWSGFGYGRFDPGGYLTRVSTAMTCIDLNSSQLASFPLYGTKWESTPTVLPSWSENPEPEQYADWSDFMMALCNSLQMTGDGIVWATARYADGYPARFVCLDPNLVTIEPDGYGAARYMLGDVELDRDDVCHIRYQVFPNRLDGVSPLEWAFRNLVAVDALERYATDIAQHGVWAVLKHPANLSARQAADLKATWKAGRRMDPASPAVLSGGVDLETLSLSPHDMALLDLATLNEQRICAAFRVPPYLVGVDQPGSLTYANAGQLTSHHWRVGLRTMAKKIATALSYWLLPHGTRLEFNRDEYVKPEFETRAAAYATLASIEQDGRYAMSVGEIRAAERFAPAPDDPVSPTDSALIGGNP